MQSGFEVVSGITGGGVGCSGLRQEMKGLPIYPGGQLQRGRWFSAVHTAIGAQGLLVRQTSRHTLLIQTCVVKQSGSMTHCGRAVIGAIGVQTASCSCAKQSEVVSHGIRLHTLTQRRFTHFSSKSHSPLVAHPAGKGPSVDGSTGGGGAGSFTLGGCVSDRGGGDVDVLATGITGC